MSGTVPPLPYYLHAMYLITHRSNFTSHKHDIYSVHVIVTCSKQSFLQMYSFVLSVFSNRLLNLPILTCDIPVWHKYVTGEQTGYLSQVY